MAFVSSIPEMLYDVELIHQRVSPIRPRSDDGASWVAPRTPVQKQLAEIFSEVLGVEPIGIHDVFFTLGGHSLLAMQALSRMREAFQVSF
jgi:hypothetical protein